MHWLTGVTAGICAAIAILAGAYGVNAVEDWYAHREVNLGQIEALENDPGYPNREGSIRSAREQVDASDRAVRTTVLISALVLALAIAALVPLWRRAALRFSLASLTALVAFTAIAVISSLALLLVILSAGVIRG